MLKFNLKKGILGTMIAIALFAIAIKLFLREDDITQLTKLSFFEFISACLIAQTIYVVSGLQVGYLFYKQNHKLYSLFDFLTLQVAVNLWGILIPFQGAMIYLSSILKFKYKSSLSQGLSISMFSILTALFVGGLAGIYFSLFITKQVSEFLFLSFFFVLLPLCIYPLKKVINQFNFLDIVWLKKIFNLLNESLEGLQKLISNKKVLFYVFIINLIYTIVSTFFYWYVAHALELDISIIVALLFSVLLRIGLILKFTPGNIGIEELLSGGIFLLIGLDPAKGVLITLAVRVVTIMLMLTVGIAATFSNFKYFRLNKSEETV